MASTASAESRCGCNTTPMRCISHNSHATWDQATPGKGRSKSLGGFPCCCMGSLPACLRVGGGEIGPELNLGDVGDAGPGQPVAEVRALEIAAERRRAPGAVDGAGVDDNGPPAREQPGVAVLRVEAEDHAGLADDVDELLQDVGDAVVPHRDAEQVVVGGSEPAECALGGLPRDSLI